MEKSNIRKLLKWQGIKKELPWILFIIVILLIGYDYYSLKKRHNDLLDKECVWNCMTNEFIEKVKEEDPTTSISCDYKTRRCLISGTSFVPEFQINISELNWNSSN